MGQETVAGAVFQRMVVRRIGRMLGLPVFEVVRPPLLILAKRRPSWERLEVFGDKLV